MLSTSLMISIAALVFVGPSESQRRGGPSVATEPQNFEAEVGTSITLPCDIRNVGRRSVFWFKGNDPEGRELLMQMKSIRGTFRVPREYQNIIRQGKLSIHGSNLIINDLESSDSDTYTCSVAWARQSVTHSLSVRGAAPVQASSPFYVTATPSDGQVTVGEGLTTALSCIPAGEVPATVSWYREGDLTVLGVGNVFNLIDASREDNGRYVCRADDGVSDPVSFYFDITVEYVEVEAPEVVALANDMMVQITCQVVGHPDPQVSWYSSTGPITEDERHHIFSEGDMHHLQITQMTSRDLGDYQCYGYNDKSRNHATITVSAAPGPVTIVDVSNTPGTGSRYTVTWEVNSLSPISYYYVALRKENSEEVTHINVGGSTSPNDGESLYRASNEFDLNPGQTYEFMIKAVTGDYQPGPDMKEPYVFSVPYGASEAPYVPTYGPTYEDRYDPNYEDQYGPHYDDEYGPRYDDEYAPRYDERHEPRHDDRYAPRYDSNYQPRYDSSYEPRYESTHEPRYESTHEPRYEDGSRYEDRYEAPSERREYVPYESHKSPTATGAPGASEEPIQGEEVSDEDVWKWWKVTMTIISRLPQVARLMQEN